MVSCGESGWGFSSLLELGSDRRPPVRHLPSCRIPEGNSDGVVGLSWLLKTARNAPLGRRWLNPPSRSDLRRNVKGSRFIGQASERIRFSSLLE